MFLKVLKSDFIPRLIDVEEDEEAFYIIEEYIKGFPLKEEKMKEKNISDEEKFSFIFQLLQFLTFIHERENPILYVDWKPENIIITEKGVKVIDFGSALFLNEIRKTPPLATTGYSAPEISFGEEYGFYTDIYGFGCILEIFAKTMKDEKAYFFKKSLKEKVLQISKFCKKEKPEERWKLKRIRKEVEKMKPSLKKKDELSESGYGFKPSDRTIAVCGLFRGVGTTHIALLVAKHLLEKDKRLAFVDYGKKDEGETYLSKVSRFSKRVEVFEVGTKVQLLSILNRNYQHIVIDFGMMRPSLLDEILRCDKKMIVMQDSMTKNRSQENALTYIKPYLMSKNTDFVINLSEGEGLKKIGKKFKELGIKGNLLEQRFQTIRL